MLSKLEGNQDDFTIKKTAKKKWIPPPKRKTKLIDPLTNTFEYDERAVDQVTAEWLIKNKPKQLAKVLEEGKSWKGAIVR